VAAGAALIGLSVAPAAAQQPAGGAPDFGAIDRFVDSERQAMRIPGVAIGIVQGDHIVHLAGFGQADPAGRPMTAQTPMIAASITKSFTALAVMQLVEAGKVDLDEPIQRYIPWFRVADEEASARITVRHLLNQTSGLPTAAANVGMVGGDMGEQALEHGVRALARVALSAPVGSTYQYSNFNYETLGMLVQVVSGDSYEQYLQQHVLNPLDMRRTYTSQAAANEHGLATGYQFWFGQPVATDLTYSRGLRPAGGLISTSEDLAHYLIAQVNGGQYAGASVLSTSGIGVQHLPAVRIPGEDEYYGMGWQTSAIGGIPIVHHDGKLPTGFGDMVLVPSRGWGIVVLANGMGRVNSPRLNGIATGIANVLLGQAPVPAAEDRIFQAVTVLAFAIIGVQIFGIIGTARRLRRWRAQPDGLPTGALALAWHVGLPLALNLVWGSVVLFGLTLPFGVSLFEAVFLLGDFAYLLVASAALALGWGPVRTLLVWRALQTRGATSASATFDSGRFRRWPGVRDVTSQRLTPQREHADPR
jgi:CubicO group peptidase (beta-lactamase class C family)